jgi:hypothetical protein
MFGSEQVEAEGALGLLRAHEAGEATQEAAQVAEEAFRQPTLRPLRTEERHFLILLDVPQTGQTQT